MKNPIIIASKKDLAGMNIIENLKLLNCKIPIKIIEEDLITAENIDKNLDADFIIFASKHKSQKENKTLSIHSIGNFQEAEYGGKPKTLSPSSAIINKHFFQNLEKNNNSDYQITLEATHHGPFIETPSLFIEIGSTKNQWQDKEAGKIIAKTIIESVKSFREKNYEVAICIGGPHYCPNFNEIQLGEKFAISHVMPEHALPLTDELLNELVEKTVEKIDCFILDWKGLGKVEQRNNVFTLLEKSGKKILRTKEAKLVD